MSASAVAGVGAANVLKWLGEVKKNMAPRGSTPLLWMHNVVGSAANALCFLREPVLLFVFLYSFFRAL